MNTELVAVDAEPIDITRSYEKLLAGDEQEKRDRVLLNLEPIKPVKYHGIVIEPVFEAEKLSELGRLTGYKYVSWKENIRGDFASCLKNIDFMRRVAAHPRDTKPNQKALSWLHEKWPELRTEPEETDGEVRDRVIGDLVKGYVDSQWQELVDEFGEESLRLFSPRVRRALLLDLCMSTATCKKSSELFLRTVIARVKGNSESLGLKRTRNE